MKLAALIAAALTILVQPPALPDNLPATYRVIDGDTMIIENGEQTFKVRLECIDAPELGQPFGREARDHLRELLQEQTVTVVTKKKDIYGRFLAVLYFGVRDPQIKGVERAINVNKKMVVDGYAWSYMHKNKGYNQLEEYAQRYGVGLWSQPTPESPWNYRKRIRKQRTSDMEYYEEDLATTC